MAVESFTCKKMETDVTDEKNSQKLPKKVKSEMKA